MLTMLRKISNSQLQVTGPAASLLWRWRYQEPYKPIHPKEWVSFLLGASEYKEAIKLLSANGLIK